MSLTLQSEVWYINQHKFILYTKVDAEFLPKMMDVGITSAANIGAEVLCYMPIGWVNIIVLQLLDYYSFIFHVLHN